MRLENKIVIICVMKIKIEEFFLILTLLFKAMASINIFAPMCLLTCVYSNYSYIIISD